MKRVMAVYQIENTITKEIYVGSTINYTNRIAVHRYKMRNGMCSPHRLYNDGAKYGESSFRFSILEIVNDESILLSREQFYIDKLNPQYNVAKIAGTCLGVQATDMAKAKMSKSRMGKNNCWYGKTPPCSIGPKTEETKKKISQSRIGEKNPMFGRTPKHAKLTDDQVREVRSRLANGEHSQSLADDFGVSKGAIQHIKKNRSYRNVL